MELAGKRIVVVGGSSGFGRCVAELALQKGAELLIGGRTQARIDEALVALKSLSGKVSGHVVDVQDAASLKGFLEAAGAFDHLVSTVGGAMGGGFLSTPIAEIVKAVNEKVYDNLRLAQAAAGQMRAGGSLTFTGGTGGRPHTASGAYLGNQGILTMAESLASELAPKLRVNVVAPTWTITPFWRNMPAEQLDATQKFFNETIPLGRTARIEEVASAYIFLMENSFITGQQIAVDGGVMLRI